LPHQAPHLGWVHQWNPARDRDLHSQGSSFYIPVTLNTASRTCRCNRQQPHYTPRLSAVQARQITSAFANLTNCSGRCLRVQVISSRRKSASSRIPVLRRYSRDATFGLAIGCLLSGVGHTHMEAADGLVVEPLHLHHNLRFYHPSRGSSETMPETE